MGFALAEAFLASHCRIMISGRTQESVLTAVERLCQRHPAENVIGQSCDVREYSQVKILWEAATNHFNHIDIWINNAGVAHAQANFWEHSKQDIDSVVGTNILGTMYGTQVALTGMLQQGHGAVYNMEGLGSDGRIVDGLAVYGSTKSALRYLNRSLEKQLVGNPVILGALSPGMLVTEMLTAQYKDMPAEEWERAKRVFNLLADRVEDVAPWMAKQILMNKKSGVRIKWLTRGRLISRLIMAPFFKRKLFADSD